MEYTYQYINYPPPASGIDYSLIYRIQDNTWIPNNPENTDWQAYQEWLAAGNTPLPPEA